MTMDVNTLMSMNDGCEKPVGAGVIAYPCRLAPRHEHTEGSPCAAPEVAASIRRYNDWERLQRAQQPRHEGDVESAAVHTAQEDYFSSLTEEERADLKRRIDDWADQVSLLPLDEANEMAKAEPTKKRPGDQVLPQARPGMCAQDLVIAEMETSKRVGLERYGQAGLWPFNGRRSFQDIHEEVRDLHVYLTQLLMEVEASGDDLVDTVHRVLTESDGVRTRRETAEAIVDTLGGWVLAHRIGDPS